MTTVIGWPEFFIPLESWLKSVLTGCSQNAVISVGAYDLAQDLLLSSRGRPPFQNHDAAGLNLIKVGGQSFLLVELREVMR
jgi:hypothetical protein